MPKEATYARTAPSRPKKGIKTIPSDIPKKKPPNNPCSGILDESPFKIPILLLRQYLIEFDLLMNFVLILSEKSTAPIPIINRMDMMRIVSSELEKTAPKPDTSIPIKNKVKVIPPTMANGLNQPPADSDIMTGNNRIIISFETVTIPAMKTVNIGDVVGIIKEKALIQFCNL